MQALKLLSWTTYVLPVLEPGENHAGKSIGAAAG